MIKVKMFDTGEVVEVTPNVAHDLIDGGKAKLYCGEEKSKESYETRVEMPEPTPFYGHRQMRAERKGYKKELPL
jgi:hypothetical protein